MPPVAEAETWTGRSVQVEAVVLGLMLTVTGMFRTVTWAGVAWALEPNESVRTTFMEYIVGEGTGLEGGL